MGFAGPCFPRDNVALAFLCRQIGASPDLLETNDRYNRLLAPRFVEKLAGLVSKGETVAVLGLAYKPMSHVVEESQGVFLARAFADAGLRVVGFDPLASQGAREALRDHALIVESLEAALHDASLVVITTPDDAFKQLTPDRLLTGKKSMTVVDFWRCLSAEVKNDPAIRYIGMGTFRAETSAAKTLAGLWQQ
jgi:UDPglucose 6-dehydrogenase